MITFDLVQFLERQKKFSSATFGPGDRTIGIIAHIEKEIKEIESATTTEEKLGEFVDIVILALDAMWRLGYNSSEVATAIWLKQDKNIKRKWPDWRTRSRDEAIEHDREHDGKS